MVNIFNLENLKLSPALSPLGVRGLNHTIMNNIVLVINGEQRDFETVMKEIVMAAFAEVNMVPKKDMYNDFDLEPQMAYPVADKRILAMFGVTKLAHPEQSVINSLRSVGLEPIKRGRRGSLVYGHQVSAYFKLLNDKQHDYKLKD